DRAAQELTSPPRPVQPGGLVSDPAPSRPASPSPLEVVGRARDLIRCLRSSESGPEGIRPAGNASGLEIALYNLIHGSEKTDPNRPTHSHLVQGWGDGVFDAIGGVHAALIDIMVGSGCSPQWTAQGWVIRQSATSKTIPTELLTAFERVVD